MGDEVNAGTRLRLLLLVHLIVGVVPVGMYLLPFTFAMLPVMWAIASLSIGQAMLLAFFVGMAPVGVPKRILGGLIGAAYLSFWQALGEAYSPSMGHAFAAAFFRTFPSMAGLVAIASGVFLLIRLRGTEFRWMSASELATATSKVRYTVHHLLLVMAACAVVLTLARQAGRSDTGAAFDAWQFVAGIILVLITFPINTACAAWAVLSPSGVLVRTVLVAIVAILLGIAFALTPGSAGDGWWLWAWRVVIPSLSALVVYLSLLVVRSCGYRLVPRLPAG